MPEGMLSVSGITLLNFRIKPNKKNFFAKDFSVLLISKIEAEGHAWSLAGVSASTEAMASSSTAASSQPGATAEGPVGAAEGASARAGQGAVAAGQVQGPMQLSSTSQAWKYGLGDADVGKWDLIYRQAPIIHPILSCITC